MMAPVECALEGVHNTELRESLRASFSKAVIPGLTQAIVPKQPRAVFRELSKKLTASIESDAPESVRECTVNVAESARVFDALPATPGNGGIPSDAWRSLSIRDEAMADNALAALRDAGGGNILLFAHTSHVLNAPMRGGRFSGQQQPPLSMGEVLRRSLGNRYVAIVQIEAVKPVPADPPPGLTQLLHSDCTSPCMISPSHLGWHEVRIGINGDDQELIDPATAASFYLMIPEPSKQAQ